MTGSALKVNLAKVSITLLPSNNRYENGTEKIRFMGKFTNLIQGLLSRGSWGRGAWQGVMGQGGMAGGHEPMHGMAGGYEQGGMCPPNIFEILKS